MASAPIFARPSILTGKPHGHIRPAAEYPTMTNKDKRYAYYRSLAPLLGANGNRVQLPCCLED